MNRGIIGIVVALSSVAALGALYSTLPVAAPASTLSVVAIQPAPTSHIESQAVVTSPTSQPSTNPESERLEARRVLYESVDSFLQAGEIEKARKLLDEDQERHGDDLAPEWRDLEQSYRIIADCLDHPTPRKRARAQAFTLVSQAAALKSRILAACKG